MKTIKELQQELDAATQRIAAAAKLSSTEGAEVLSNVIRSINRVSAELTAYSTEAEVTENSFDFKTEELKPLKLYSCHPADTLEEYEKSNYLTLLCSSLFNEKDKLKSCLSYIFGIGEAIGYTGSRNGIYSKALNLSENELESFTDMFRNTPAAKSLIADMIVLSEKYASDKTVLRKYITTMIELLGIDSDDTDYIISFSKVLVTGNPKELKTKRRFVDADLKKYIDGMPKLKQQIINMREPMYLNIEPMATHTGGFLSSYQHTYYDVKDIHCRISGKNIHCNIRGNRSMSITYPIPSKKALFELAKEQPCSWIPIVGFFHSPLDSEVEVYEWYKSQPEDDPKYSYLSPRDLYTVALDEGWDCNYDEVF
ncbi:MAG: hypothetical protein IJ446_03925 [Oscillospiraceae bacterium]|nr:hypothetical protein [Oscillospiraceae bacterium]